MHLQIAASGVVAAERPDSKVKKGRYVGGGTIYILIYCTHVCVYIYMRVIVCPYIYVDMCVYVVFIYIYMKLFGSKSARHHAASTDSTYKSSFRKAPAFF